MDEIELYPACGIEIGFLHELLAERDPSANISHKKMPTWEEHVAFFEAKPYSEWHVIYLHDGVCRTAVGSCYITKMGEIGIQISRAHQRKGYARTALNTLIEMHKGRRLLANIAPGNEASQKLFEGFGFKHIQNTFELERA